MGGFRLDIQAGLPYVLPLTYARDTVPTHVDDLQGQIRSGDTPAAGLVLDLAGMFTQATPGALVLTISEAVTETMRGLDGLWWDLYGRVDGVRVPLVAPSPVTILGHVSELT